MKRLTEQPILLERARDIYLNRFSKDLLLTRTGAASETESTHNKIPVTSRTDAKNRHGKPEQTYGDHTHELTEVTSEPLIN